MSRQSRNSSFMRRTQLFKQRRAIVSRHRKLLLEQLEARHLLAGNLLINGSFEEPAIPAQPGFVQLNSIPSWEKSSPSGPNFEIQRNLSLQAADGNQ